MNLLSLIPKKYLGIGIALVVIGGYMFWLFISNQNSKIELLEVEKKQLQEINQRMIEEHKNEIDNLNIKLENQKITFQEKETVINSNSKLKQEVAKRGEVKNEDNFISFTF